MYKQWGEGVERLLPIYPQYANTIIRWGKEEVEEAIINKNKRDNAKEFLYWVEFSENGRGIEYQPSTSISCQECGSTNREASSCCIKYGSPLRQNVWLSIFRR